MTSSKFTVAQAAKIIGKNRATVSRHIKSGKLSYELDKSGKGKRIDAAELIRCYGSEACKFDLEEKREQKPATTESDAVLKVAQGALVDELRDRIQHLEKTLDKTLDVTRLIEDRSSDTSRWQELLDATTAKITTQTDKQIASLQDQHNDEIRKVRRALYNERNKSVWEKIFGRGRKRAIGK